jgi:flagellar basal-body rod modification protein FlgD
MQVNGVSSVNPLAAYSSTQATNATGANSKALDATQFMQLLMAQLTHQDPLEPMNNAEMLSQFSQLNSLQELRDIRAAIETSSVSNQTAYLASLIGKTVKYNRTDGKPLEGVVEGVVTEKDNPQLLIGDETVDLSDVLEVKGAVK